jgi:hypothetical protein
VTFRDEVSEKLAIPRAVSVTVAGRNVQATVVRDGPDVAEALARLGPVSFEPVGMSLEDAFIEYTAGGERRVPFGEGR